MDTDKLMHWLGLPPGAWPPEPRALLGLKGAPGEDVQAAALAQMEKLRPHQLMSPELVTEGMNRLAQALVFVEDAVKPVTKPPAESEFHLPVKPARPVAAMPAPARAEAIPIAIAVPARKKRVRSAPAEPAPLPPPLPQAPTPPAGLVVTDRRKSYQRLAQLRREQAAWEKLGPFFGVPSRSPQFSNEIYQFLDAVHTARRVITLESTLSPVTALVRQGVPIAVFRDLQPPQRETLATAWAQGLAEIQAQRQSLRRTMKATKPPATAKRVLRHWSRRMRRNPEWILAAFFAWSVAVVFVRLTRHPTIGGGH